MYDLNPLLFNYSKFRQYKIKVKSPDNFVKIKNKIYRGKDLKNILDHYMPIDCYQTISYWLNPDMVGSRTINKRGYPILSNFFLGSDYIMDFDIDDYSSNHEMIDNFERANETLFNLGFKQNIQLETQRGYQILVTQFNNWVKMQIKSVHPRDREYAYLNKMKQLTAILKQKGLIWDMPVSNDTRRIFRVPNTYHNSGKIITILNNDTYARYRSEGESLMTIPSYIEGCEAHG